MKYKIIVDKQPRNNPSSEKKEYEIDIEELRVKGDVYDSLMITKDEDYVIRRLSLSKYHVLSVLKEPLKEPIQNINIKLFEGDNYIYLVDMEGNKFYAEYLVKNDFNDLYVTKNEMNSSINQTEENIELSINQKLEGYSTTQEMNSAIEVKADSITSSVSATYATKNELSKTKSEIKQTTDSITSTVSKKVGNDEIISKINQSAETVGIEAQKINLSAREVLNLLAGNTINLSSKNIQISSDNLDIGKDGKLKLKGTGSTRDLLRVTDSNNSNYFTYFQPCGIGIIGSGSVYISAQCDRFSNSSVEISDSNGYIEMNTSGVSQSSLEKYKKNFEKLNNGLEIINSLDIYKYNLKEETNKDKKHIGFVIGNKYKYSKEITSKNNDGVDLYSFVSVCCKAIQEQQKQIQHLREKNKQKDNLIENLAKRLEILEKEVLNGKD